MFAAERISDRRTGPLDVRFRTACPVTPELLVWADLVFVMERAHRAKLSRRFKPFLRTARVVCLDIPDNYALMDPELVRILEARVPRLL